MPHIYRAVVRGEFDGLSAELTEQLRREAPEHDIFPQLVHGRGHLTFDDSLHAFSFRFEVREPDGERSEDACRVAAQDEALRRARAYLDGRSIGSKRLRASVTNMADMWRRPSRDS
ncbi:MAG: hypothetical protein IPG46_14700 [Actinobacteria bacterium]|nr:hypothetical protein [Actinomycetota bacterium]